jgi:two-component system, NtrC family, sensor kinase
MASFFVIRGPDHGQHFDIRSPKTTIGRDSSNSIRLNDSEVSRQHAVVTLLSDGKFELRDAGSSNGTFVNSHSIEATILRGGDRVQIGRTLLAFNHDQPIDSTHSIELIEITPSLPDELSHIRSRAESRQGEVSIITRSDSSQLVPGESVGNSTLAALNNGEIVYQVSQAIRRTVDIAQLLDKVLQLIFQWIECDRGCIMLHDELTGEIQPSCSRTRHSTKPAQRLQISRTILDHVIKNREGVLTSNAQTDSRWNHAASIAGLGIREAICVPMQGRYGTVGAIYIDTEISAGNFTARNGAPLFEDTHLKLLVAIAGQAAMAIEDTQFYHAMLQAERLATMGQTIANVSHHVKNILQGISGGNYLVEDGLANENIEIVRRGWAIVKKNQYRISSLVMDMLSFSKDREPELSVGNVNQVIADVVELMTSRAAEAGVTLVCGDLSLTLSATMDSEAIHRALLNVVTNGIDAVAAKDQSGTPPEVRITSDLDLATQRVQIVVADNGTGIAADQLSRIFAPFHSSKGTRGTGLGLPVSQKIMREHGGDIIVQSKLGEGSRFILYWPIRENNIAQTMSG